MNDYSWLDEEKHKENDWKCMIKSIREGKTRIPEWVYEHFLGSVPPIYCKKGFLCGEMVGNNTYYWFYGNDKTGFYGELKEIDSRGEFYERG